MHNRQARTPVLLATRGFLVQMSKLPLHPPELDPGGGLYSNSLRGGSPECSHSRLQTVHLFLALDAIDSPGNGLESLLGNFPFAFETRTVLAGLEPRQRDFDLAQEAVCPLYGNL